MQQTRAPATADGTRTVAGFAARGVLAVAALVVLGHLAVSFSTDYWLDERYMLGLARHPLQWGYVDQPPVAPLLAWLCDHLAPGSMIALRVPAILATAATVVVGALVARELGADRRAQVITAVATAGGLGLAASGHFLTPYGLEPLEWGLLFLVLLRWQRTGRDRLLLWLGVVVGVGAQTKFQMFLLCAVLIVALLVCGPRRIFTRPLFWVGALIAVVLAAPTLLWQAANGWPQVAMGPIVAQEARQMFGGRPALVQSLITFAGVSGLWLGGYGLWRLARDPGRRFLAVTFVVLFAFFVVTLGRNYYLDGYYPVLAAAGAVGLQRRREQGNRRWRWAVWPASALTLVAPAYVLSTVWALTNPADGSGGAQLAATVATAYHRMAPPDRDHTAVLADFYVTAADLDAHGRGHGLPLASSPHRGYGYLPLPSERFDRVLYVGHDPNVLRPSFATARRLAPLGDGNNLWLFTGKTQPWSQIWTRTRSLAP